ncbi:MAG TPA: dTDP-4-dehydrorhamnose 3,5-epimerase [Candidatus Binatia bacterium]|nr:dTDP-4-dehydrorhamnose 3,5-epimerase [Candidatus Binatia bacterium]
MRSDINRIPAVKILTANHYPDERGFLLQSWVKKDLDAAGIPSEFKQAIQTFSKKGVVRGLHFQWDPPMGKLVRCISGSVIDVVVDVRHGSPTLGDHIAVELSGTNHRVIWAPPGFAHGTFALQDDTIVLYECSGEHGPGREGGILWNDPDLGISWPDIAPIVSAKDREAATLSQWLADPRSQHFRFARQ